MFFIPKRARWPCFCGPFLYMRMSRRRRLLLFVERQKMTECSEGYATIEITVMVSYVWMIYSPSQPRARARVEITPRSHCARGNGEHCVKNGSPFRSSPPQARRLLLMLPMTVGGWSKIRKKFLSEEIAVSQNFAKFSHWEISN